uniref:Uncharacterized protein n=1 Tax=Solanum tuberosum TaxID=4113 RepID=M1AGK1_SOLTU
MGQIIPHSQSGKKFLRYLWLKNEKKLRPNFEVPRAREILHEWDNILTIDIGNGPEKEISDYQVWFREDRNSISPEGLQPYAPVRVLQQFGQPQVIPLRANMRNSEIPFRPNFEVPRAREILHEWDNILTIDIGNGPEKEISDYQVWFREDRNSISPEGFLSFDLFPQRLICVDYELADHPYFTRSKARADMTDSGASDQNGLGLVTVLRDEPETSEGMEPIPYDEHITNLMQKMANMQSEIDRLRNLTNLSITLNSPLPEHGTNTTTPPFFPHVDSPTPQYFPPYPFLHKTNPTASKQSTNPQQPDFPQNNPQRANPLPFTTPYASQTSLIQTSVIQTNSLTQTTALTQTALPTQKYQTTQHVPVAHTAIPNMQYVPQVYVAEAQPFLIQCQPCQKSIHMKRWRKKQEAAAAGMTRSGRCYAPEEVPTPEEISSANLKRKSDIPLPQPIPPLNQSFSKAFAAQGLEEAAEDNLTEELKNLFIEEVKCNMILEDCTEAPTIWDAMPGDALNNWTCNPSPVLRESR